LNDIVREHRESLQEAGIRALPSRVATRVLRSVLRGADAGHASKILLGEGATQDIFLSAINILGRPESAFLNDVLYPETERRLTGVAEVLVDLPLKIVLTPVSFVDLVLGMNSEQVFRRVQSASWDKLYELSWTDLVEEFFGALPHAELLVVAPSAVASEPDRVMSNLFGAAGEAVLKAVILRLGNPVRPPAADIESAIGLDAVTIDLLDQRFKEDLVALGGMTGVQVLV
jgi:hypothetical protein